LAFSDARMRDRSAARRLASLRRKSAALPGVMVFLRDFLLPVEELVLAWAGEAEAES
jgi:hypothetical protein